MTITHDSPRAGDVERNFSDISKASSLLHWFPRTDITSGLENTIEYFLSR